MNILGRLTADAKISTTPTGKEVVNFSIAINDGYRSKEGQWVDNTTFIDCAYWRTVKVAKWLQKGLIVDLTGHISTRAWNDQQGNARAGINFHTELIKPLWGTGKTDDTTQQGKVSVQTSKEQQTASTAKEDQNDDLPF